MLIRSQDGKKIVPLNRPISVFNQRIYYCDEQSESEGCVLGKYNSDSRCLEILDEIQHEFQYSNHFSSTGRDDCPYDRYGVYQMPEK